MPAFSEQFSEIFRAGAPLIYCEGSDDERITQHIVRAGQNFSAIVLEWRSTSGVKVYETEEFILAPQEVQTLERLLIALPRLVQEQKRFSQANLIVIALDAVNERDTEPENARRLKDLFFDWEPRSNDDPRRSLVVTGVGWSIPATLAGYVQSAQHMLPTREEIIEMSHTVNDTAQGGGGSILRLGLRTHGLSAGTFADRACGLAKPAIELLIRRLASLPRGQDPFALLEELKREEIRRTQILEIIAPPSRVELGGFENFKRWFTSRQEFFRQSQRPHLRPRGVMLLGFPGCGKSHAARWVAQQLKVPLVSMDLGRVQDRWVGSSEARMRLALQTLEAAAPVVLFIDEIEKAVAGFGQETSGVTTRLVGQLLTWLADHRMPVFVIATCNDDTNIPKELTRAGRFDASFVVQPPSDEERGQILDAVAAELGVQLGEVRDHIIKSTGPSRSGHSGAELRQLLVEAAYAAGVQTVDLRREHVDRALSYVNPMVRTLRGKALLERYRLAVEEQGCISAGAN